MRKQVKIFYAASLETLEADVNLWLGSQYPSAIIDIKFQDFAESCSAMIIYEVAV